MPEKEVEQRKPTTVRMLPSMLWGLRRWATVKKTTPGALLEKIMKEAIPASYWSGKK